MNNITYYFGAGASYSSMPILNELSKEMQDFIYKYIDMDARIKINDISPSDQNPFVSSVPNLYYAYEFFRLGQDFQRL